MPRNGFSSLIIGIVISVACLWYAFRGVDLAAVARVIGRVAIIWVLASVSAVLVSIVIRAVRWRLLLVGVKDIGTGSLISATFIGAMANNLLPARLGELVRAWVLARREQTPVPAVLASVVVERVLDVLAALAILGACLALSPQLGKGTGDLVKGVGLVVLLLVAISGTALLLLLRFREQVLGILQRWSMKHDIRWTGRVIELMREFLDGLVLLRGRGRVTAIIALSFLVWAVAIVAFYVLAEGFGLGLTLVQTSLVFVIVLFGIAIPSAPGFVGTFHGFCVAGLVLVAGTEPALAAAYATLLHGTQWVILNLAGLGCLWMDRSMSWPSIGLLKSQS